MAIVTTRLGVITDALVTAFQAAPALAPPVEVYDGPVTAGNTYWTQALFVGFNGDWQTDTRGMTRPGAIYESVLLNRGDYNVGTTSQTETLDLQCCAEAWSGDPNPQAVRNSALTVLAAADTVVRTNPTLGVDGSTITKVTLGVAHYAFDDGGFIAYRIPFTVQVQTYLSSS